MSLRALIDRDEPSWWELFRKQPYKTLAQSIYNYRQSNPFTKTSQEPNLKVVCISDTHNEQPIVPDGDLLIHAGDLTQSGSLGELQRAIDWLESLPHQHKIVIAGNHDLVLDSTTKVGAESRSLVDWGSVIYLQDQSTLLHFAGNRSLSIYGNPLTRKHGSWCFEYERGDDAFSNKVPDGTDIIVTHSPPAYHLDLGGLGDYNLLREVWRIRPKLHVFGHIHAGRGQETLMFDTFQEYYERTCHQTGGIVALFLMMAELIKGKLFARSSFERSTTLVNAATVGGSRDNIIREPIIVLV